MSGLNRVPTSESEVPRADVASEPRERERRRWPLWVTAIMVLLAVGAILVGRFSALPGWVLGHWASGIGATTGMPAMVGDQVRIHLPDLVNDSPSPVRIKEIRVLDAAPGVTGTLALGYPRSRPGDFGWAMHSGRHEEISDDTVELAGLVIPSGESSASLGIFGMLDLELPDRAADYWVCSVEIVYEWRGLTWREVGRSYGFHIRLYDNEKDFERHGEVAGWGWGGDKC